MPANPNKDDWEARRAINKLLTATIKQAGQLDYENLVLEISLAYQVSIGMIENFIDRFYVRTGKVVKEEGVLRHG